MNIVMERGALWHGGASFGYIPKNGIAGSAGRSVSNFLRNLQTDFQGVWTSLQSHQQWRSVPLSPHPCQQLFLPEVLILAILIGVRCNLRVVLICIPWSLRTLNIYLGVSQSLKVPLFVNSLFRSIYHFLIGLFGFLVVSFLSSYIFWILVLYQMWG